MTVLVPVLGDQLSHGLASLRAVPRSEAVVLMAEVMEEATYVPHHRQKLVLVFSAMRHFARELAAAGWRVDYRRLDDPSNLGSLSAEVAAAARRHGAARIVATLAGEHRVIAAQRGWQAAARVPVELLDDDRFLVCPDAFAHWARGRKRLRMEEFYRWQRTATGILMDGDQPIGGRWNFDADNRKPLPPGLEPPPAPAFGPDALTQEVMAMVEARFPRNFGRTERFHWPVTRAQALTALDRFVTERLARFGDFQDALSHVHDTLFHSVLSAAINLGLLGPREVIDAAVRAFHARAAPLNAVEGFVRQILGWREYVRGIYFLEGPDYVRRNAFAARRPLPRFYWTGDSGMACLDRAVAQTRELAYAHHIQRLMVLGNFALVAGIDPFEVHEWFLVVYADAYEWVEAPNVIGMSLHADGGLLGSKPYAASGAYLHRMGDHCRHCRYDVAARSGPRACPFNLLY
ncbi:MAG: cryptochrome/photolyase family protein [Thermaurantiacus sp.]|uniref:cryptochrome/photolyase family protein n=1 Tax=Thermaurantiacus sp. TaxID=2820283 RepID=UPI00298F3AE4|nr:cryptochrome/photolyase family protein [Thermaurantiacus sp.]MDW8415425.1 cryptochrome/photolyase family protein [Thermaurantiacus sp.]